MNNNDMDFLNFMNVLGRIENALYRLIKQQDQIIELLKNQVSAGHIDKLDYSQEDEK